MPVCGPAQAVGGTSCGMGYHGNIWLKTNAGAGETEIESLSADGGGKREEEQQTECLILKVIWILLGDGK